MTGSDSPAVVVQRVLTAQPGEVYDEWLDAEGLTEWMCPRPARALRVHLEPKVGGRFRIDMEEAGDVREITGQYLSLERPHRLRFTWAVSSWSSSDPESIVTVTFAPHGTDQTMMTINHTLLPPRLYPDYEHGWTAIANQLSATILRGR
jgi:uncharacterized protein YndB with AHSA1/START domain